MIMIFLYIMVTLSESGDFVKKNAIYIFITTLILSFCMTFVDVYLCPPYVLRSAVKVLFCVGSIVLYCLLFKDEVDAVRLMFKPNKRGLLISICIGVVLYALMLLTYCILRNWFDFAGIVSGLTDGTAPQHIPILFAYIALINSFVEESFFRGLSFMILKKHINVKWAYVFSSLLFAIYHVGMMYDWQAIFLFVMSVLGLSVGGCIFNYVDEKTGNIYPSYVIHMCTNFGLNTIGLIELFA